MPTQKMHANEVEINQPLVRRLLSDQFPQWADLPLTPVESAGTDNAIFRLGLQMAVRLPRIDWAIGQIDKERTWLPRLAPHLSLVIPALLAIGQPDESYPWQWAVYTWIAGRNVTLADMAEPVTAAVRLAQFVKELQAIDTRGAPTATMRAAPLAKRDTATRQAIAALSSEIDAAAASSIWEDALNAPGWDRPPVWVHGDLLPGNVLFKEGQLHAVIDFGGLESGDPACDLMIAWGLFSGNSRRAFREALAVDDALWARGRGHALSQAAIFIPYYRQTNPAGVARARHMMAELLAD